MAREHLDKWHVLVEKPFAYWRGPHYFMATIGLVCVAVVVLYYGIITSTMLPRTPMTVSNYRMDIPDTGVCSGHTYSITYHFKIDRPMVIAVYRDIQDAAGRTIFGTEMHPLFRVYPEAIEVVEHVHWTVPVLPEGDYYRAISFVSQAQPSIPIMLKVPFKVRKSCRL